MIRNIMLMKMTEQGAKDIKGEPARIEQSQKAFEQMGGKLLGFYVVTGEYDYIAIAEMPSEEAGLTFNLGVTSLGNVKVTTCRAYTLEEFAAAISKIP